MHRRVLCVIPLALCMLASCASVETAAGTGTVVRYGAGSAEDSSAIKSSTSPASVTASAPASAPAKDGAAVEPVSGKKTAKTGAKTPDSEKNRNDPAAERAKLVDAVRAQALPYEESLAEALGVFDFPAALAAADQALAQYAPYAECAESAASVRERLQEALSAVSLVPVDYPAETAAGTAFRKPFRIKAVRRSGEESVPLAGFPVRIGLGLESADASAPAAPAASVAPSAPAAHVAGADGIVSFQAPVPQKAGKDTLVFSAALSSVDPELSASIADLASENGPLSVSLPHTVFTNAKRHSTTISILDYDKNGKPIRSSNPSATALLKPLVQRGFGRIGMADFPDQIAAGDSAVLFKAAKSLFGSSVRRFIWGTVKIASLEQGVDNTWTCILSAEIAVHDFVDNAEVFSVTLEGSATAKTEASAITAARAKLAGELLVDALYYGM
ncbi:MAG TPA: hypothetical protein PKH40_08335 [Treponemataceae bacterium]|nr:hypothetical protein [Treponemataceae bacterium]